MFPLHSREEDLVASDVLCTAIQRRLADLAHIPSPSVAPCDTVAPQLILPAGSPLPSPPRHFNIPSPTTLLATTRSPIVPPGPPLPVSSPSTSVLSFGPDTGLFDSPPSPSSLPLTDFGTPPLTPASPDPPLRGTAAHPPGCSFWPSPSPSRVHDLESRRILSPESVRVYYDTGSTPPPPLPSPPRSQVGIPPASTSQSLLRSPVDLYGSLVYAPLPRPCLPTLDGISSTPPSSLLDGPRAVDLTVLFNSFKTCASGPPPLPAFPSRPNTPVPVLPAAASPDLVPLPPPLPCTPLSPSLFPAATCRSRSLVHIILPLHVPLHCTEHACKCRFTPRSLDFLLTALRKHLLAAHCLSDLVFTTWCSLCHLPFTGPPEGHACFLHIKYFVKSPRSRPLPSPPPIAASLAPPSSQAGLSLSNPLPDPLVASPTPLPTPISFHSPPNLSSEQIDIASARRHRQWIGESIYPRICEWFPVLAGRVTGMVLELDLSVLSTFLDDDKLLHSAASAAASTLRQHLVLSSVIPPTPDDLPCPPYQTPSPFLLPPANLVTSLSSPLVACPSEAICRRHDSLHLVFPTPGVLRCTEVGCKKRFNTRDWSSTKFSLTRHLRRVHQVTIISHHNWCSTCLSDAGVKPSLHPCLSSGLCLPVPPQADTWICPTCCFVAFTKKGLENHCARHTRDTLNETNRGVTLPILSTARRSRRGRPRSTQQRSSPPVARPDLPSLLSPPSGCPSPCISLHASPSLLVTGPSSPPISPRGLISQPHPPTTPLPPPPLVAPPHSMSGSPRLSPPSRSDASPSLSSPALSLDISGQSLGLDDPDLEGAGAPAAPEAPTPLSDPDTTSPLLEFALPLSQILSCTPSLQTWELFLSHLQNIEVAAGQHVKLPPWRGASSGDARPFDITDAAQVQRLYRRNRRRAIRLLTQGESDRCPLPTTDIESHFLAACGSKPFDPSIYESTVPAADPIDMPPFTAKEVRDRLFSCENTAPGNDRLTYQHWRSVDPDCKILTSIFNICLAARRIPATWKAAKSVLLHKAGDQSSLLNWRPIALSNTIYKLFAGCLARRFSNWLELHHVLSPCQKGFLPADGVFEHNYLLHRRIQLARSTHSNLCIASLDFSDAFGSIPHEAISTALSASGAGDVFRDIVSDIYSGATTEFLTDGGCTSPISILSGVRQGCPLSGYLYDLCADPILRAVDNNSRHHGALAYADDVLLLASSPSELQIKIDTLCRLASKLSITINISKCFSLHLSGQTPVGVRNTSFNISGVPFRALATGDAGDFLGKPFGFLAPHPNSTLKDLLDFAGKILGSKLAPWQILDGLKTFFFPSLHFLMRTTQFSKGEWRKIDLSLRPALKKVLNLPPEACNSYLHGTSQSGMCAIPVAAEDSDIAIVDGAFKLLSSADDALRDLAWADLSAIVARRLRSPATPDAIAQYLSGDNDARFRRCSDAISSTWSAARAASTRLHISWTVSAIGSASFDYQGSSITPAGRRQVCRILRTKHRQAHSDTLLSLRDQGKAMTCVAASPSSSHFMREGSFTRFADWRFVHRARLNLVPLNACRGRFGHRDIACRRCGSVDETLPHVVNHCRPFLHLIKRRHDAIVHRIKNAATRRFSIIAEDQECGVPGLRPDLVLAHGDSAIILDVTIPFDNSLQAFSDARDHKINKYTPLAAKLRERFHDVSIEAFVVGSLGSWDVKNEHLLRRLCSRSYAKLLRRLCVSDAIRWSRDIYIEFLTGQQQNHDVHPANIPASAISAVAPRSSQP